MEGEVAKLLSACNVTSNQFKRVLVKLAAGKSLRARKAKAAIEAAATGRMKPAAALQELSSIYLARRAA